MKILLTFLACLAIATANARTYHDTEPAKPIDAPRITITVIIGLPLTCILDWGICGGSIDVTTTYKTDGGVLAYVEGGVNEGTGGAGSGAGGGGGGSWYLGLNKDSFARNYPGFLSKLEGQTSVRFLESFTFSDNIRQAAASSKDLMLQKNVPYSVQLVDGYYRIRIPY